MIKGGFVSRFLKEGYTLFKGSQNSQNPKEDGIEKPFISDLQGVLSFDGGSGVKWEFSFLNLGQTMHGFGRGFFNSLQGRWVESELRCGEASLFVHGHEKKEDFIWDFTAQAIPSDLVSSMLKIASLFGQSPLKWSMEQGIVSGSLQLCANLKTGALDWKVPNCSIGNLHLRNDRFLICCDEATVYDGDYLFSGACLSFDDHRIGENWTGQGNLSSGFGSLAGNIGDLTVSSDYEGTLEALSAYIQCNGTFKGEASLQCSRADGGVHFAVSDAKGTFFSAYTIEAIQLHGDVGYDGISCFDVKGVLDLGKKVPFYCPIIQSEGVFDLRFVHPLFDIARLVGTVKSGSIAFDEKRSHFLGSSVILGCGFFSKTGLENFQMACSLPWKMCSFFCEIPPYFNEDKSLTCRFSYDMTKGSQFEIATELFYQEEVLPLALKMIAQGPVWQVSSNIWDGSVEGNFVFDKDGLQITQGRGLWTKGIETEFSGRISSFDQWELNLSHLRLDLGLFRPEIQGILQGTGILHWKGALEADFDLTAGTLKIDDWAFENEGSLHVFCSSKMGLFVQGLNVSLLDKDLKTTSANCKIGLFKYNQFKNGNEREESLFTLTQVQFHMLSDLFPHFSLWKKLPFNQSLQGVADLTFSSDFSNISLSMKEALLPIEETQYHLHNLHVDVDRKNYRINFDLDHRSRLIPIDLVYQIDPLIKGRLTIENGLKVDWTYQDRLCIQSIEGMCAGIETSFHLDGDSLIGSARVNGNEFRHLLPEKIAKVFHELKVGKGYELMGRLSFVNGSGASFRGIISGKQIELFGFELKNILAQIEWDTEHLSITNLKVSDFAGVLKVESISAHGVGDSPWTISIPHIIVTELRPSLLQDVGGPPGKLSPLVVREIRIDDFQGLVDDSKTYTANGWLYFINSYKRESSILELPSDWLSRIVGLDLDLLVPVCGTLKYELRDGFFHFTELLGSYSENKRSEFFLVFNEDSPKMDLDWNVNIFIQTKQFVLFKFTEAFIISITGKLDEPKFQLQRKKRFLGVL